MNLGILIVNNQDWNFFYYVLIYKYVNIHTEFCHRCKCASKGPAKGDAIIFCVLTMCSSNKSCASSMGPPLSILHPVFLYNINYFHIIQYLMFSCNSLFFSLYI